MILHQQVALQLTRQHKTILENVIKEYYQIYILNTLFNSQIGNHIVFKGGTAIRLAYNSFRFSEDLDFSIIKTFPFHKLKQLLQHFVQSQQELQLKELYNKKYTYFARIVIKLDYIKQPIGIKIEMNKQPKIYPFSYTLIQSPFNPLQIFGQVYTLEGLYKDKQNLIHIRQKPRDLFDLWYLSQRLNKPFVLPKNVKYTKKQIQDDLNIFLPSDKRHVVNLFVTQP